MTPHNSSVIPAGATVPAFTLIKDHRVAATTLLLLIFPLIMPNYSVAINILIYGLFALGFNILFGYMGMLSFGHAAFLGTGAYGAGILISQFGAPWWLGITVGVVVTTITAWAMGVLAIRTRGIYFAMVTLALSQCVYFIIYQFPLSGGENGLRGVNVSTVHLPGVTLDLLNPLVKYYFFLGFVVISIWILSRILNSPFGAVIQAVRENESRARACGYDIERTKLITFIISGAFCGLAGTLSAIHLSSVAIETLHYQTSGMVVMICLLGGMGTFFGPFIGAALFLLIQDRFSVWTENWQLYVGIIFVILVLYFPKGVWGTILEKLNVR